jgi:peptidoglycan/LPS O-acetylase OafA/YrhL
MVLSGFIFTVGMLGEEIRYGAFIRNRVLRIYPLYLVLLFVGMSSSGAPFNIGNLAWAVFPVASFGPVPGVGWWGAMFWAVAVEVQFYLVFPFLFRLLNRSGPSVLVRMIAAMVALRGLAFVVDPANMNMNGMAYDSIIGRLDQFLLGMLVAWVYTKRRHLLSAPLLTLAAVLAVGMLWVFSQLHGYAEPRQWWRVIWVDVEGVVWAVFIGAYVSLFAGFTGRASRLLAKVGEMSYSIYLLHVVVIGWVLTQPAMWLHVGGPVTSAAVTGILVVLPITLAVSMLTYHGIERPFLTMRGNYHRRTVQAVVTAELPTPALTRS